MEVLKRGSEFICRKTTIKKDNLEHLMFNTEELAKDVGTVLVGIEAVENGIINEVGGIKDAFYYLYSLINQKKNSSI